jgi:hypothetical protein
MRQTTLLLSALLLLGTSGCVMVDCAFIYHVQGTIVDGDTGDPLPGSRVAASGEELASDTPEDWPGWAVSDQSGRYTANYTTGPAWGYQLLFGFIPLGSKTGPVPPPLDTFFITAEDEDGILHSYEVATAPGGQTRTAPAQRWLELGELSVGGLIED